jgi:hypothetical protein
MIQLVAVSLVEWLNRRFGKAGQGATHLLYFQLALTSREQVNKVNRILQSLICALPTVRCERMGRITQYDASSLCRIPLLGLQHVPIADF